MAQQSVSRWLSFLSRKGQRSIFKGQKRGLKTYRSHEKLEKALLENVYCNFSFFYPWKKNATIIFFYILLAHSHFCLPYASRAHFFAIFHGSGLHFRPSNDPSWSSFTVTKTIWKCQVTITSGSKNDSGSSTPFCVKKVSCLKNLSKFLVIATTWW